MGGEDGERAIEVENSVEPPELGLIDNPADDPAPGKWIQHEGRYAHGLELPIPHVGCGVDAARSRNQDDQRKAPGSLGDPQNAGDRRGPSVRVSLEKLFVRKGQGVNWDGLDPRR